jgi:hypothetical protein
VSKQTGEQTEVQFGVVRQMMRSWEWLSTDPKMVTDYILCPESE